MNSYQSVKFKLLGNYFGYPKCCITWYVKKQIELKGKHLQCTNKIDLMLLSNDQYIKMKCGFIPCPECAKKLVDSGNECDTLIEKRICKNVFPDQGKNETANRFINRRMMTMKFIVDNNNEFT